MNDLILIIPLLGLMGFYYYLLSKLDRFVSRADTLYKADALSYKDILVYKGAPEVIAMLASNHIQFDLIECFDIPKLCCYKTVLGISDNDLDNLLICKTAKHFDPCVQTLAKCNFKMYQALFSCEEIDAVVQDAQQIEAILKEWEVLH